MIGMVVAIADALIDGKPARLEGRLLSRKLASMGPLVGRSKRDLVTVVGPPLTAAPTHDGELLEWHRPGYKVAVRFDAHGRCLGITHETLT